MNGILLVNKDAGWTSSDVVCKLKGILHQRRVGHSGTLDPMATGLLAVFAGRATRAVEFAEAGEKRYIAALRLGMTTDTQDVTGTVLSQRAAADIDDAALEAVLARFRGEQLQLPPMYSAVKVNGQRLYKLARRGEEAERRPRPITVSELRLAGRDGGDYILDIRCSKGTYIRTLCSDIGEALGCGGCMSALKRVSVGGFELEDAHSIDEIQRYADEGRAGELLLPVDTLFRDYEACTVSPAQEKCLRSGAAFRTACKDGSYRVYSESGEFLMLGLAEGGVMKTVKSFFQV